MHFQTISRVCFASSHATTIFCFYCTTIMIFSFQRFIIILVLILATSTAFVNAFFTNNVTDQQALLSFKASITSDPLGVLSSWNNSIHFCEWTGVTCSHRHQRVTALNLYSQNLVGTLSSHIGNLSFLRTLQLCNNEFRGSIPNEIGRLFRLQNLSLGHNYFEGGFPANLSNCVDLRNISMHDNNLEGELPSEFASWSKLYLFIVYNNHFTGPIPPSIGNISSSLRYLDLNQNKLGGSIPLEIAHLTKLGLLGLGENNFRGMVPLPLYNISSLYVVDLGSNELEGTIPAYLGFTQLPNLQEFYAGTNRFSGPIPPSITNASNLVVLDISGNNIIGPVPINFGSLPNLKLIDLSENPLGDNQNDLSFFNSLVNCTHLNKLDFSSNGLRGELPNSIVNLSTTIQILDLFGNHIYGSIPQEIGKLVNMRELKLNNNLLAGTIPESIGELSKLGVLFLGENNISGVIPTSISNITQLGVLNLEDNMLHGSIPIVMFDILTLQELYLSTNLLNGMISKQIVGLSAQFVFLDLRQNQFTGPLPSDIGSFRQLVQLDVSYNKLTGEIPATMGDCVMLENLYMEGNLFQGVIPSSFKALQSLRILDLSNNNMSGSIPRFFDGFHLIEFLNLSHNKLGGEVPKVGLFSNSSRFSIVGNLWLCGGIEALQLPACPTNKKNKFPLRIILLVLLPFASLLACLALIVYRRRKSKQMNVHVAVLQDNQYPRLSYQDLLRATNEFSLNNLLGEGRYGSVYKGVLESLEQTVAVKILNGEVRGANKSFLAECETLRNIRHRNLIKIITACSSTDFKGTDFKALVLEFMTNGSLENWLHPSPSSQGNEGKLTLLQRLNICIDVALGLDYLHHHSHASIIHCDIKPSNILLDEEFVARVGDFGLARFSFATTSDTNQAQTSSTGVRGTVGYVPPEYGMGGEISTEGDVYSYGILLLEMFSGKRPTCSSIVMYNCNNLHDYVKMALPQRVLDIADPRIVLDKEDCGLTADQSYSRATMEICMASIFEVGILCSVETPRERIDISLAIKRLHVARDKLLQCRQ